MGKGTRSPLLGYNHNVRYRGRIYHVQTEDSGPGNPHIFTHLFFEGTILASKKNVYDAAAPDDHVRGLMQGQHKSILKELKQARFDERIFAFFDARGADAFLDAVTDAASTPDTESAPVAEHTLDLDALPPVAEPTTPAPLLPPEPLAPPSRSVVPGPGVYSMKKGGQERPFEAPPRPEGVRPLMPPLEPRTPPPVARDSGVRQPVVVIRPPIVPRPRAAPPVSPPSGGVIVQRTVVVGGAAQAQRPRRPHPPVPYVVKEGSHPIVQNARAATTAPAIPGPSIPAPGPAPTTISDKSLDEVILAYLSQDDEGQR